LSIFGVAPVSFLGRLECFHLRFFCAAARFRYYDKANDAPPPVGQVEVLEEQRGSGAGLVFEGSQLTFRNFRGFRGIPQGDRGGSTENQVFLTNQTPEPP
jgi:hypothetical protein